MHAGELETSVLLHIVPDQVRADHQKADYLASSRPLLLSLGMQAYTSTGVIGSPVSS